MLVRIMAMLTRLVVRFDPDQYRVRERASGPALSFSSKRIIARSPRWSRRVTFHSWGLERAAEGEISGQISDMIASGLRWLEFTPFQASV